MTITISSHNLVLPQTLRQYALRRFLTLQRHFDRPGCRLHVELEKPMGRRKPIVECRVELQVPQGHLVVHKRAHDLHEAIDLARKTLGRVLDDWYDRVLLGSRRPKKYFVAREIERERLQPPPKT